MASHRSQPPSLLTQPPLFVVVTTEPSSISPSIPYTHNLSLQDNSCMPTNLSYHLRPSPINVRCHRLPSQFHAPHLKPPPSPLFVPPLQCCPPKSWYTLFRSPPKPSPNFPRSISTLYLSSTTAANLDEPVDYIACIEIIGYRRMQWPCSHGWGGYRMDFGT